MFYPRRHRVGDPITRAFVNEVIEGSNMIGAGLGIVGDPISTSPVAMTKGPVGALAFNPIVQLGDDWRASGQFSFWGEIMPTSYPTPPTEKDPNPPDPEPDYEDARYWVAEIIDGTPLEQPQSFRSKIIRPRDFPENEGKFEVYRLRWTTAINVAEYESDDHAVPMGTIVRVHAQRSPGGRLRYWFHGGGGGGTGTQYVILTNVDVDIPGTVRGRRAYPTSDLERWAVQEDDEEEGDQEEEFRTEFGIPSIHYKAFEWTDWRNLNSRGTLLPIGSVSGVAHVPPECQEACDARCEDMGDEREQCLRDCIAKCSVDSPGTLLFVRQRPKWPIPEDPPDLRRWPRTECWLF